MDKKKIKLLPVEQFPETIELSQIPSDKKVRYAYLANRHIVENEKILVVTFFSLKLRIAEFRVFFNKDSFVVEKLHPDRKWSNASLDTAATYWNGINYIPVSSKTASTILAYFHTTENATQAMIRFQQGIRRKKLEAKYQRIEDSIDEELSQVEELPADLKKWVHDRVFKFSSYIYYKRRTKKIIDGYCTVCRKDMELDHALHNEHGTCPNCGAEITFKAKGKSTQVLDKIAFNYIQRYGDGIMVRLFSASKAYMNHYNKPEVRFWEIKRVVFIDKQYQIYYYGNFYQRKERWCRGDSGVINYDWYGTSGNKGLVYPNNIKEILAGTPWKYCQIERYAEAEKSVDAITFIHNFVRHPEVEYVVKMGLFNLAQRCMDYDFKKDINYIMSNRRYLPLFRETDISSNEISFCKALIKQQIEPNKELIVWAQKNDMLYRIESLLKICNLRKGINYITKQKGKKPFKDVLTLWEDYLKMCKSLKYNVKTNIIKFPKELIKRHDEIAQEFKEMQEEELRRKIAFEDGRIRKQAKTLTDLYYYEYGGLLIKAPLCRADIVKEGETLSHCVYGYTERVAKGKTIILFIRKKKAPDEPFYTLELLNGEVYQCMGKHHCAMTKQIESFVDRWFSEKVKKSQLKEAINV